MAISKTEKVLTRVKKEVVRTLYQVFKGVLFQHVLTEKGPVKIVITLNGLSRSALALDKVKAEFETDNGRLAIITPDRYGEAYNIMGNHFTPDEPLSQAFAIKWNKEFETMTHDHLVQNLSICMIAKDTNEIMGIRLIGIMKKTDPASDVSQIQDEPLRSIYKFLTHKDKEVNFFERFGVDEAIHFYTLGVHKNYRRMGLGGRLLAAAVAMSRELGFKAIKGEGTSNFSQRIYEKQGFETIIEIPYSSYIYKGKPIRDGTGDHTMTKVYGLKL